MKIYISDETTLSNELYNQLQHETSTLGTKVKLYKQKKKTIVGCMNKINTSIENIKTMESTKVLNDTISELKKALNAVKYNIENTKSLNNTLVEIKDLALKTEEEDIYGETYHNYLTQIYKKVNNYNEESERLQEKLGSNDLTIELFMQNIINYSNFTFPNSEYNEEFINNSIINNSNKIKEKKQTLKEKEVKIQEVNNDFEENSESIYENPKKKSKKELKDNAIIKNMMVQNSKDHEREKNEYNSLRDLYKQIKKENQNNIDFNDLSQSIKKITVKGLKENINDGENNEEFDTLENINSSPNKNINKVELEEKANDISGKTKISIIDKLDNAIFEDNDVLLISEKKQKVYLPYKVKDLQLSLSKNSKYASIEDVIADKYVVPMKKYKNTTMSRFKEAYNLKKKKSNGKLSEAINLGMELAFNYNLNPAIISACRNEEQLDEYLDCLDENEIDKFSGFKIKYDIAPMKLK